MQTGSGGSRSATRPVASFMPAGSAIATALLGIARRPPARLPPAGALAQQLLVGAGHDRDSQARSAAHEKERGPHLRAVDDAYRLSSFCGSHDRAGDVVGGHCLLRRDAARRAPVVLLAELIGA